jgi:hypothetical protein
VFSQENLDIYQKLMLRYFSCTTEKDVEETKGSEDKPVGSKPKPTGSTMKPNDEKPGATEAAKTSPSKGRGNRKTHTSNDAPPGRSLSGLLKRIKDLAKSNSPKDEDNSHPEGSKGKVDDSGSSSRKRKDVDGEEKMDTSENDVGDTTKLVDGTTKTAIVGKGRRVFNKEQFRLKSYSI